MIRIHRKYAKTYYHLVLCIATNPTTILQIILLQETILLLFWTLGKQVLAKKKSVLDLDKSLFVIALSDSQPHHGFGVSKRLEDTRWQYSEFARTFPYSSLLDCRRFVLVDAASTIFGSLVVGCGVRRNEDALKVQVRCAGFRFLGSYRLLNWLFIFCPRCWSRLLLIVAWFWSFRLHRKPERNLKQNDQEYRSDRNQYARQVLHDSSLLHDAIGIWIGCVVRICCLSRADTKWLSSTSTRFRVVLFHFLLEGKARDVMERAFSQFSFSRRSPISHSPKGKSGLWIIRWRHCHNITSILNIIVDDVTDQASSKVVAVTIQSTSEATFSLFGLTQTRRFEFSTLKTVGKRATYIVPRQEYNHNTQWTQLVIPRESTPPTPRSAGTLSF